MHIVVCVKQVPDSSQIRVHPVTNTIMRQGVPAVVNPLDLVSLEEALSLKERLGAHLTVLSMGPKMAVDALKKCISFGADDAILLTDRLFAGSDTLATSYILSSAIQRLNEQRPVDIVFCGQQSLDGETAQVGPGIARRLGYQQLTYVARIAEIDVAARRIVVERRTERGTQTLETRLPCLVTMLEGANSIRFAGMDDMFRAARYTPAEWDHKATGVQDKERCGLSGSPTAVKKVFAPQPRASKATMIETTGKPPAAAAEALLLALYEKRPEWRAEIGA